MNDLLTIPGETKTWVLKRHRILGKGSFGCATLYEEVDVPNSFVVVKDINMQTMKKEDEMKALEMEVDILRRSRGHPNIVHFLDYHHDGEFMVYIVMEYCAGGDLAQLEEQLRHRLSHQSERFVASILIQMLAGLHYLHVDQRTLHRDIKPQNVFICSDGVIRIGDFGVSTVLDQYGSKAKAVCGSPFYMAPELCEEKSYDGKADVWSLGVMMYELMVLERPFNASSVPALTRQITRGVFNPIPRDLPYSASLVELVESLLQVSSTARPTLRRLLRSSYVQSHLNCIPLSCLLSSHYMQLFNEDVLQKARKDHEDSAKTRASCCDMPCGGSSGKVDIASKETIEQLQRCSSSKDGESNFCMQRHETNELDKWLEANGGATDALIKTGLSRRQTDGSQLSRVGSGAAAVFTELSGLMAGNSAHQRCPKEQVDYEDSYEDDFESESSD